MRTRASVAVVLTVVGLSLTIAAMSIRYWVVKDDFSDLPNYPNPPPPPTPSAPAGSALYIGVKTFIFVPATGPIVSDNLGGPIVQGLLYNVAVVGDLNAGGDAVIGSGTVALLLAIAAVIFTIRAMINQTQAPSVMAVPIGLNVLAGALLAVGALLYARKLGVDWSFLVFTASSAFMLTSTVLHARELFGKPLTKMRHGVAIGLLIAGIGVAVLSMSTSSWMSIDITQNCQGGPGTYHLAIGLKRYWQSYSGCPPPASYSAEGALSALQGWGSLGVRTDDGGTMVIVLGSIALAMAASSVVLYLLALQGGPRKGQYQFFSVILSLVGAFLLATAVVLYAKKLFLSLSFVFLVGGGFLYFAAAFILLALSLQPPKIGSNGIRSSVPSAQAGQTKEPLLQVQTSSDDDPQLTGAMPHSKMSVSKPRISALD